MKFVDCDQTDYCLWVVVVKRQGWRVGTLGLGTIEKKENYDLELGQIDRELDRKGRQLEMGFRELRTDVVDLCLG